MTTIVVTQCFYDPIKNRPIDAAISNPDGTYTGMYSAKTQAELEAREQTALIVMSDEEAYKRQQEAALTAPKQIEREDFHDALNMLPPAKWVRYAHTESFHCIEFYTGNVTRIYTRIGERYYSYLGYASTSHAERIAACEGVAA